MKKFLLLVAVLLTVGMSAQNVGEMDFKNDGFTEKKFKNAEKKIFIHQFTVNYQTVMIEYAKAKRGFGHGGAMAGLALGLDNVTEEQLQKLTDNFYSEFVQRLKSEGYTIVAPEEVASNSHFSKADKLQGGKPYMDASAKGYLLTLPTGFTQYLTGGMFNLAGQPESKALGGIIVARVNITVPFAEAKNINGGLVGGVAKIVAKADLRVSPLETIPTDGDFKKPTTLISEISFAYKKNLKWQALYKGKLKKSIEIEGVLDENKKYKATSVATSGSGFTAKYSKSYAENAQIIDCDANKYEKGVNEAISKYIKASLDGFTKSLK